jgi:CDP-diacylglycerol--glycerol-3-phosphate 3-phosphatidyltransferase
MLSARTIPHPVKSADYAQTRLRGTVWEHSGTAHVLYRAMIFAGGGIGRIGISANALTYGSLVCAMAAGIAAALGAFGWAAVLVLASGTLDVLDGVVARATRTVSRYGALLDSTVDRLADGLPLLGVAVFYGKSEAYAAVPALAMLGGFTISYVRARAEALGAVLPALFMRRAERVLLLTLCLLLGTLPLNLPLRAPLLLVGLAVVALLNFAATFAALRAARQALGISTVTNASHSE